MDVTGMIGRDLSHYRILEMLGEGGMGAVYVAEDRRLERRVALKVLPPGPGSDATRLQRFEREARAVAALSHPNIVTVHSVEEVEGVHFITMELVEGEPLDRLIPDRGFTLGRFFGLAIPLADAVSAAHGRGITHRDLKPANVMVDREGRVKVLDFGLAKLIGGEDPEGRTQAPTEILTREGVVLGTMPYMSPEQVEGLPVDPRTDIFSLGVLFYEMLTGARPFRGKTSAALISSILRDMPLPLGETRPDLPRQLGRILEHCLEKNPQRRFQSALDLRNELDALRREMASGEAGPEKPPRRARGRWLWAAAGGLLALLVVLALWWSAGRAGERLASEGAPTTVAVLPFQNLGSDTSYDYLGLAIPDEVTTALARAPDLAVRPFVQTAGYRGERGDPGLAGRELKVASVVTGQYYRANGEIHLTLEAIDVGANRLLWRSSVQAPANDLIAMREDVSTRVRETLLPRLGARSVPTEGTRPASEEAYEIFLKALATSRDPAPNRTAIGLLERASELDPAFAPAWSELAMRYYYDGHYAEGGPEAYGLAEAAARRALELDPSLTAAAGSLITMQTERGRLAEAYDAAAQLLERRPDSAWAHFEMAYVLRYGGLLEESIEECEAAVRLDPGNHNWRSCGLPFELLGRFEDAERFYRLDAGSEWNARVTGSLRLRQGRRDEGFAAFSRVESVYWEDTFLAACRAGSRAEILERARELETEFADLRDPEPLYWLGSLAAYCGATESALSLLRSAVEDNYCAYPAMDRDPLWASVRDEPEFAEIRAEAIACRRRFEAHRAGRG